MQSLKTSSSGKVVECRNESDPLSVYVQILILACCPRGMLMCIACFDFIDVRCKNKFWGKSMEIVPVGTTHVTLPG